MTNGQPNLHPNASRANKSFEDVLVRLAVTNGLLQLGFFGWDQMVRSHPTQFTEIIHADFDLNRSAGEVGEFGCHPIGATELISASKGAIATPGIWKKSRVVRRAEAVA